MEVSGTMPYRTHIVIISHIIPISLVPLAHAKCSLVIPSFMWPRGFMWLKVAKSGEKRRKVGKKVGKKWWKVGKSGLKWGKMAKSREKWR